MDEVLVLYANCIPVKGALRAALCDLQLGRVHLVPHSLCNLINDRGFIDMNAVSRQLDDDAQMQVWAEYRAWLIEEGLAFMCTEAEALHYPRLSAEWDFPAVISNCIIDAAADTSHIDASLLHQLEALCCNFIQFRFFAPVDPDWLEGLMQRITESQVKTVSLVLAFNERPGFLEELEKLLYRHVKVQALTVHGCDREDTAIPIPDGRQIQTTTIKLTALHCGIVSYDYFAINISAFTEALHHNSCLNRKLSIDAAGYIKNCPAMATSYGHVKDTRLAEVLARPDFKRHWDIGKDEIAVCRDCEFRYICTDCRAYIEEPDNEKSKPLKCGYDPYTATWSEWSRSALKQKAIQYYGIPH